MKSNFLTHLVLGLFAVLVAACGGGEGTTPQKSDQLRPLSADFTARKAVNYSPFRTAINVDDRVNEVITEAMVKQDLELMRAAGFGLIRLFDSSDKVARLTLATIFKYDIDIKVQLGAYIQNGDDAYNRAEIARTIALANQYYDIVLAVSVGNETMVSWSFNKFTPEQVGAYLKEVRAAIRQPVTTDDNYAFWAAAPNQVTDHIDFAALHTYTELDTVFDQGLWDWKQEAVPEAQRAVAMMDASIVEAKRQYQLARDHLNSKGLMAVPIIIGE
jgi:exo-beta-1,3-glucanase (GH17 family)